MTPFADWDERTLDLCVDRFTVGLDGADEATLEAVAQPDDVDEFERAVAAVHLALLERVEPLPMRLLERLDEDGRRHVGGAAPAADSSTSPPPRPHAHSAARNETSRAHAVPFASKLIAAGGWLTAAALLFFLLPLEKAAPTATQRRAALVSEAQDLVQVAWAATEDPAAAGATGDVVWSSARQEGYMRFEGLAPNDPSVEQYQLWVFDPSRADWEAKPVDGGVFDVSGTGPVVVPIDPKLAVSQTALFAVTVEVPGGVVVSERERIVLTATPAG